MPRPGPRIGGDIASSPAARWRRGPSSTSSTRNTARALGLELHVLNASTERDFDRVFAQLRAGGLVITPDNLFLVQSAPLATLTLRYGVAAAFESGGLVAAGGLARCRRSYIDSYRGAGVYVGRILKGEKESELPVPAKIKLFLNLKTARALGLTIPLPLLARADEVFE